MSEKKVAQYVAGIECLFFAGIGLVLIVASFALVHGNGFVVLAEVAQALFYAGVTANAIALVVALYQIVVRDWLLERKSAR